jgi:hypothetical protein
MKKKAWVLILLAGCSGDAKFSKIWGDLRGTIGSPTKVEAYRIVMPEPKAGAGLNMDYATWKVTAGPIVLDAPTAQQLGAILLDAKSYYRGPPKSCLPLPGVRLIFTDGRRTVTLLVCLECSIVMVSSSDGHGGGDDFDPAAPAIVAIMKKLFPKDPEIQAFK